MVLKSKLGLGLLVVLCFWHPLVNPYPINTNENHICNVIGSSGNEFIELPFKHDLETASSKENTIEIVTELDKSNLDNPADTGSRLNIFKLECDELDVLRQEVYLRENLVTVPLVSDKTRYILEENIYIIKGETNYLQYNIFVLPDDDHSADVQIALYNNREDFAKYMEDGDTKNAQAIKIVKQDKDVIFSSVLFKQSGYYFIAIEIFSKSVVQFSYLRKGIITAYDASDLSVSCQSHTEPCHLLVHESECLLVYFHASNVGESNARKTSRNIQYCVERPAELFSDVNYPMCQVLMMIILMGIAAAAVSYYVYCTCFTGRQQHIKSAATQKEVVESVANTRKVKNDMIDDMPAMQRDIERQCCEQSVSTSLKSSSDAIKKIIIILNIYQRASCQQNDFVMVGKCMPTRMELASIGDISQKHGKEPLVKYSTFQQLLKEIKSLRIVKERLAILPAEPSTEAIHLQQQSIHKPCYHDEGSNNGAIHQRRSRRSIDTDEHVPLPRIMTKPALNDRSHSKQAILLSKRAAEPESSKFMEHVVSFIESKWYEFGVMLKLEHDFLKTVEGKESKRRFMEVFHKWKDSNSRPFTWETVIDVLRSEPVDKNKVADNLEKHLMGKDD